MQGVFLQKEINDLGGKQRQKHAHTDEHKEYEMFAHCSCPIIPRKASLAIIECLLLTTNNGNIVSTKKMGPIENFSQWDIVRHRSNDEQFPGIVTRAPSCDRSLSPKRRQLI